MYNSQANRDCEKNNNIHHKSQKGGKENQNGQEKQKELSKNDRFKLKYMSNYTK